MEISNLQQLKEALTNLDQQYNSTYITPEAIFALQKTIQSFNITITDWNTLITYINLAGSTLRALYATMPDFIATLDTINSNMVDISTNQQIAGTKTFTGKIKVPNPTEHFDAVTKLYADTVISNLNNIKVDKLTDNAEATYAYTHYGATQNQQEITVNSKASTIVSRDENAQIYVPSIPTNPLHAASKDYVDRSIISVYKYKGSVATPAQLPTTGLTVGDVYDVQEDGQNYAWNGTSWDSLGINIQTIKFDTESNFINNDYSDLAINGILITVED